MMKNPWEEIPLLVKAMNEIDYSVIRTLEHILPNEKKLVQIDFGR